MKLKGTMEKTKYNRLRMMVNMLKESPRGANELIEISGSRSTMCNDIRTLQKYYKKEFIKAGNERRKEYSIISERQFEAVVRVIDSERSERRRQSRKRKRPVFDYPSMRMTKRELKDWACNVDYFNERSCNKLYQIAREDGVEIIEMS